MRKRYAAVAAVPIALAFAAGPAYAWGKVTICHATASQTNPYVKITVAVDSFDNGHGVHGVNAGDIVPPFVGKSGPYPGHNWDAAHQAIWNNGCVPVPPETTTTTVPEEVTTTTVQPVTTTTEPATTSTTVGTPPTSNIGTPTSVAAGPSPSTHHDDRSGTLPFTGSDAPLLIGIGTALATVGAVLARARRRRVING